MKAIILAAGYGTRLEKDLQSDLSGKHQHLIGLPKELLPIANKPLINYLVEAINQCVQIDSTYIITNHLFYDLFKQWATENQFPLENIISDTTRDNENRLGAIADIALTIKQKEIDDDLLIVAGDTLFYPDFKLEEVITQFYQLQGSLITCYHLTDDQETMKRGIIEIDHSKQVINFLEKPSPEETSSRLACPPLYIYHRNTLPLIHSFLAEKATASLQERDAPGNLVKYLYQKTVIFAHQITGRFDVGGLADYIKTNKFFGEAQI